MLSYKKIILLFLSLSFLPILLFSQTNDKQFYRLIPNNQQTRRCFNITRTNDGFVWFVTEDGVSRYDGKIVKNYIIAIGWRGILRVNSNNELFLCNANGICFKYNELKDCFEEFFRITKTNKSSSTLNEGKQLAEEVPIAFKSGELGNVSSMTIDHFDRIWVGTRNGPVCFNPDKNTWTYIQSKELKNALLLTQQNRLYIFTPQGISYIDITDKSQIDTTVHKIANTIINSEVTSATYEPNTGNVYFGTANKGLFCLTKNAELVNVVTVSNSVIRSVVKYDQNTLLIGFDGLGIYEYDIYTRKIVNHYVVDENKVGSIGSNAIYDILVDNDKRIWVANYTTGVEIYDPNNIRFSLYNHMTKDENSLIHNNVLSIVEDKYKNLWFGTFNGLSVKKKASGNWAHFLINNSLTQTNRFVNTLCTDFKGNVWAGGVFGIQVFNPSSFTNAPVDLKNEISKNENKKINSIFSDNQTIWAVGIQTGMIKYDIVDNKMTNFPLVGNRCIDYEDDNHLFILGEEKITSFNKLTGEVDFGMDSLIKRTIKSQFPEYLCFRQKNNNLWIASKSFGVIQYSKSTNSVYIFNKEIGITSNHILSLEIDNDDCVWIATDEGLCYLNPVTKIVVPFKIFPYSEKGIFNINASKKLADGTIIFGTKDGAVSFDPQKMFVSPSRGHLAFTDFLLLNKSTESRTFGSISNIALNKSKEIVLNYLENSFTLKFEELTYGHTILPRYSYKLEGYDNNFSPTSFDGSATYYNLSPGKYTLEIRSFYADNEGKFVERTVDIIIKQPWYNTIWAWIIWLLIFSLVAIAIYRVSKHRLDLRYSNEKINFFTNVSHDMRTPITLIKAPLGDLLLDESLSPSSRYLVQLINNNTNRLFDMINRVLDFEKADEHHMKLNLSEFDLNKYVTDVAENFTAYAEINGLIIKPELNADSLSVYLDKEKMDVIIENLLSNSIKYSNSGGYVKVVTGNDEHKWWIEVCDNGIGIPLKEQKKIFNRFYRAENAINSKKIGSGMGLMLVNKLTQFMGGNILFESEAGVKTFFRVSFPITRLTMNINKTLVKENNKMDEAGSDASNETVTSTLLFVDDNDEIRNYISSRLSTDLTVLTAESSAQAWSVLQSEKVDIVVTDIMMSEISGIELCEKIKSNELFAHIPVVLLSALSDKNNIVKGLKIGADDYITKPFDLVVLKQRIENILENRKRLTKYLSTQKKEPTTLKRQAFLSEMDKLFIDNLEKTFNSNMSNYEYTIDSLCRDIGMSRSVLFNRLKNLTNLSPNDYLRIRRMDRAAEFILSKQYSVDEVSQMVGYSDLRHFKTLFKKKFGCLPSEYRNE